MYGQQSQHISRFNLFRQQSEHTSSQHLYWQQWTSQPSACSSQQCCDRPRSRWALSCGITGKPSPAHPSKSCVSNTVQYLSVITVIDDEAVMISVGQTVLSVKDVSEKQSGLCCLTLKIPAESAWYHLETFLCNSATLVSLHWTNRWTLFKVQCVWRPNS